MARSQKYQHGSVNRGNFKPKKMNKGWLTIRKEPIGTRPVLRITEPVAKTGEKKADDSSNEG